MMEDAGDQFCISLVWALEEDQLEGIHRTVKQEATRAVSSRVPWVSSTQNLESNIELVDRVKVLPNGERCISSAWQNAKSITQKPGRIKRLLRPARKSDRKFRAEVYRMGSHSLEDWSHVPLNSTAPRPRMNPDERMRLDFLESCLGKKQFYTFPIEGDSFACLQVFRGNQSAYGIPSVLQPILKRLWLTLCVCSHLCCMFVLARSWLCESRFGGLRGWLALTVSPCRS